MKKPFVWMPDLIPDELTERFYDEVRSLECTGRKMCQGTRDNLSWSTILTLPKPQGFHALIAKRANCTSRYVRKVVCFNTQTISFGRSFARWDWKVCRAAVEVVNEYWLSVYWRSERIAARLTGRTVKGLRIAATHDDIRTRLYAGTTYYYFQDLGLGYPKLYGRRRPVRRVRGIPVPTVDLSPQKPALDAAFEKGRAA